MKKIFSFIALLLICFSFSFAGCNPAYVGPDITDTVVGNGGMVVRKGDYVYFANGFTKASESNTVASEYSTLYRAKDVDGELQDIICIAEKVVGFENSGLFIFDDKLFYAAPSDMVDSSSALRTDLIDFYVANLDGTGSRRIHTTAQFSSGKFAFTIIDARAYIVIFDGAELYRINQEGTKTSLEEDVKGAVIPSVENVENNFYEVVDFNNYAYVTKDRTEDQFSEAGETGNCVYRVDLKTGDEELIYMEPGITVTLNKVANQTIYYTRNYSASITDKYFYATTGIERTNFKGNEKEINSDGTVCDAVYEANGTNLGVVYAKNNKLYFKDTNNTSTVLVNASVTILKVKNSFVYYAKDSKLYRVDVNAAEVKEQLLSGDYTVDTAYADVDDEYFYFLGQYKYSEDFEGTKDERKYMLRTDLLSVERATNDDEVEIELMHEELEEKEETSEEE